MIFIDKPRRVSRETYTSAIRKMCEHVGSRAGIRCIFQIGSVSTPGISDIDMVVVFEDGTEYTWQPRNDLLPVEKYLFVHDLFGVTRSFYSEALGHTYFHNYQLIWGTAPNERPLLLSNDDVLILKCQTALEYLVRMYAILSVELHYRVVKLRSLFLQAKALLYDCECFDICGGSFYDAIQRIVTQRLTWFTERKRPLSRLKEDIFTLYYGLEHTLGGLLNTHPLFLPSGQQHKLGSHIRLVQGSKLTVHHRGLRLPSSFSKLSRRFVNLQHRLNGFDFVVPFCDSAVPPSIERLFELRRRMAALNQKQFPHFMSLSSSLALI